ncbi:MAG TPA: family 20 glycosylhydrolase, partial [Gemmatimonadales bacterium]|nr:family 20 glycosylhydrolase [Gemmatimonadales bacterium]
AYPELACTPGPFEVGTVWGVEEDVFCPTETTFRFLENVLTEVMALFPGRYIHIGGDEVPKTRWRQSRAAQSLMRREHLRNEEELQSWFVRRIERFLSAHGRRLVGWDEILEGGIAPEATVMSWRGTAGGIAAAQAGHDVVMSPGSHVYFDHLQGSAAEEPLSIGGYTPLDKVYAFEPVPAELTPAQARHILGAQANLWTEYIATPAHAEYMVYPRALALSEVLWSPAAARDWRGFTERLPAALRALDQQRVSYRTPDVAGLEHDQVLLADSATVELRALMPGTIHYTLDGSTPDRSAPVYLGPLTLPLAPQGTVVTARLETPDGRLGGSRAATWRRAVYLDATRTDTAGLRPGLSYAYAEGRADSAAAVATLPVLRNGTVPTVRLRGDERAERFAVTLTGWLQVPADGLYDLALSSDDGSVLWLDGQVAVNNDGYHGADAKVSTVALRPGLHALKVVMFQGSGAKVLGLSWRRAGEPSFSSIPASALFQGP